MPFDLIALFELLVDVCFSDAIDLVGLLGLLDSGQICHSSFGLSDAVAAASVELMFVMSSLPALADSLDSSSSSE